MSLNQIKKSMQHTAQEFSHDVDSAVQSVKTKQEQFDSFKHRVGEESFVVGGHLIDHTMHESITDPEIQTANDIVTSEKPAKRNRFRKSRKSGKKRTPEQLQQS